MHAQALPIQPLSDMITSACQVDISKHEDELLSSSPKSELTAAALLEGDLSATPHHQGSGCELRLVLLEPSSYPAHRWTAEFW